MNIIVYPDPKKKYNINEKNFINAIEYFNEKKYICVEDTKIDTLENYIKKFDNVKSITILLDNYGVFVYNNLDFIIKSKKILFLIHENDLHYLKSKPNTCERYKSFRSKLKNNQHIYILAHYWYQYLKLFSIEKERVIPFPKFIFYKDIKELKEVNTFPIQKILLSGAISKHYPMRKFLKNSNNPKIEILDRNDNINGINYLKYLKNFICCFTCCSNKNTPYIIKKFFEIPLAGCLLLAYDKFVKNELKYLGFIDGFNYLSCDEKNIFEKIEWICNPENRKNIDRIRYNGYRLILDKHSDKNRYNLIKYKINSISLF